MVVTKGQQYNVGEEPTVILYTEVPRNPLTRWDASSIPANGIFLTKKKKKKKMPNGWRTIKSLVHNNSTSRSTRERNG